MKRFEEFVHEFVECLCLGLVGLEGSLPLIGFGLVLKMHGQHIVMMLGQQLVLVPHDLQSCQLLTLLGQLLLLLLLLVLRLADERKGLFD